MGAFESDALPNLLAGVIGYRLSVSDGLRSEKKTSSQAELPETILLRLSSCFKHLDGGNLFAWLQDHLVDLLSFFEVVPGVGNSFLSPQGIDSCDGAYKEDEHE